MSISYTDFTFLNASSSSWGSPLSCLALDSVGASIASAASQSANALRVNASDGYPVPNGATVAGFAPTIRFRVVPEGSGTSQGYAWGSTTQTGSGVSWTAPAGAYSTGTVTLAAGQSSKVRNSVAGNLIPSTSLPTGSRVTGVKLSASLDVSGDMVTGVLGLVVGGATVALGSPTALPTGEHAFAIGGPGQTFGREWTNDDLASVNWSLVVTNGSGASRFVGGDGVDLIFYLAADLGLGETFDVRPVVGGSPVGTPLQVPAAQVGAGWQSVTLGGPTALFGLSGVSRAEVMAAGFGLEVVANSGVVYDPLLGPQAGAVSTDAVTREVDLVALRVYYDLPDPSGGGSMVIHEESKQKSRIGLESSPGAGGNASLQLRALKMEPKATFTTETIKPQGEKTITNVLDIQEWATGDISGKGDFVELGYALASQLSAPFVSGTGLANDLNRHRFRYNNRARDNFKTLVIEYGDETLASRYGHGVVNGLDLEVTTGASMAVSGSFFAGKLTATPELTAGLSGGSDEAQAVTLTGTGSYRLGFEGAETTDLTETSNVAAIQAALRALPSLAGTNSVVVTGTATSYTVTFSGAGYSGYAMPPLEPRNVSGTVAAAVSRTTQGGPKLLDLVPIEPKHVELYFATTYAALSSNKLDTAFVTKLGLKPRAEAFWTLNRTLAGYAGTVEMEDMSPTASIVLAANPTNEALMGMYRADTMAFFRAIYTGPNIGATSNPHRMIIEGSVKVTAPQALGGNQGVRAREYGLTFVEDRTRNETLNIILENGLTAYA